jgi:sterol desaturase/sphingolipid hydroxylase (fatty acid hydroxylase superfamily)
VVSVAALVLHVVVFVALAAALLVPLEQLWPKVLSSPSSSPSSRTGWIGDIAWLTLGAATLEFVVGPVLAAASPSPSSSSWLGLVGALLGAELGAYASHRLMHSVPWLWRFHAVHHDAAVMTWSKAWRQHPVDVAVHAIAVALPGLLCGVSLSGFGAVLLLRRLWTGFLHANVSLRFGVLEHVVATPAIRPLAVEFILIFMELAARQLHEFTTRTTARIPVVSTRTMRACCPCSTACSARGNRSTEQPAL